MLALWQADNFIHHLYVAAPYRQRGVGRLLLAALPGWHEQRFYLKCLSRNETALGFYRAVGFEETETGHCEEGEYVVLAHEPQPQSAKDWT
ncbi:GNAT family N-acetyltransferase [Paludibacterium yongneupense]